MIGRTDLELLPPEEGRILTDLKREVMASGIAQRRQVRTPCKSGVRIYDLNVSPRRSLTGEIIGVAGVALEVTANHDAEEAVRRLAAIVESSDDAIISKDLNGVIQSWNRGAQEIFGYTAEEVIGKSVTILLPSDRHDEEPAILQRIRNGERIDHYETVRRRKDGSLINIALTVSPIHDANGRVVGASKIARDVTERKRAQEQQEAIHGLIAVVNRAEALPEIYRAAVEAICRCQGVSRAAVLLSEAGGTMQFQAWKGLSDEYRAAVAGHSPWRATETDANPMWIEDTGCAVIEESLRSVIEREGIRALVFVPIHYERRLLGKLMVYYDTPQTFKAPEFRPVETIASQVAFAIERHRSGQALEALVNDRTASLREAIAQMEEFSYSVSHDLRAPIRAMQGYAKAVLEDYGDRLEPQGREYLERVVRSGTRMDRLVQDILTYSRLSRREIQLQAVSLDKLVHDILQQYPEIHVSEAVIRVEGPLSVVNGHEPSLSQAISNLLTNAIKFVHPGKAPQVRIWNERHNGHVRLWIEDNGIGIRPESQHRLFGMFERLHPDKSYEGTGIGLAIVRRAVERMGGKVGVESDGTNGSRFWIQLAAANHL